MRKISKFAALVGVMFSSATVVAEDVDPFAETVEPLPEVTFTYNSPVAGTRTVTAIQPRTSTQASNTGSAYPYIRRLHLLDINKPYYMRYTYDEAKAVCASLGAEISNMEEFKAFVEEAVYNEDIKTTLNTRYWISDAPEKRLTSDFDISLRPQESNFYHNNVLCISGE